jgi:hypothetical protein
VCQELGTFLWLAFSSCRKRLRKYQQWGNHPTDFFWARN